MPTQPSAPPSIRNIPTPPTTEDPENFDARGDDFLGEMPGVASDMEALASNVHGNAHASYLNAGESVAAAEAANQSAGAAATSATNAGNAAAQAASSAAGSLGLTGTSSTSNTIGAGSKSFTSQQGKTWAGTQTVKIARTADATIWMIGTVSSYNPSTGALVVSVASGDVSGAGTFSDWTITPAGPRGPTGAGFTGGNLSTAINNAAPATVASAATIDLAGADRDTVVVTGTTAITAITAAAAGVRRRVRFAGALTLTQGANLQLPGGANIVTAANDVAEFESEGTGLWRCVDYTRAVIGPNQSVAPDVIVEDQKASGTSGGSATGGPWATRALNTVVRNTGSVGSLAGNRLTLPAGTWLFEARAVFSAGPNSVARACRMRIYNATDGVSVGHGLNFRTPVNNTESVEATVDSAIATIASSKSFELQYYAATWNADDVSLGTAVSTGDAEIYARLEARRIA